ncbi:alkene reductase [Chitinophaga sp. 212800010-3]|uniref:alkene reductase n=1 Tax=unclassified Chitinophaga TaxID=2619133 RepID=UPI002DF0D731|nr:N-ethylmaleimide reductase [Chitinophaga sp. 212800010-3]
MKLLESIAAASLQLNNRVVMAPMSRRRAINGVPEDMVATYYEQRAGAGLIIAENAAVSPSGLGYANLPGIYNDAQITAWKKVTRAVHNKGGKIFIQLMHTGRVGHPLNLPGGGPLPAPSAIGAGLEIGTPEGHLTTPEPQAMTTAEVKEMVQLFIQAARNSLEAGFDGIEIHAAHGLLIEQFLNPLTNLRTDEYGGSIENRSRFLLEITSGIAAIAGANRTGVRLSPLAALSSMPLYPEELATHLYLVPQLNRLNIRYLHLSDQSINGSLPIPKAFIRLIRQLFSNWLILAGGFTPATAEEMLRQNEADLIAFGRPFIANPDLVERIRHRFPLTIADKATFYEGGETGLIDYPFMDQAPVTA